jgi:S1-C subfamily serine protease
MPDYSFEGKGVKVDGVSDNKPAFNAGVMKGDIIIKLGNLEVTDMRSYMQGLADSKKGETKELVVKRNGKDEILKVTF